MLRSRAAGLPLVVKMAIAPVLALVMLAVVTVAMIGVQREQAYALDQIANVELPGAVALLDMSQRISDAHGQMYLLLTHQAGGIDTDQLPAQVTALKADIATIRKDVTTFRQGVPARERPAFDALAKDLSDYEAAVDVVGSVMTADFSTAAGFVAPFEDLHVKITKSLNGIVERKKAESTAAAKLSAQHVASIVRSVMVAAIASFLCVALVSLIVVLGVRGAIARIAGATEALAKGDNRIDLDAIMRRDELGAVVRSLVVFRDNQLRLGAMRQEQEALEGQQDEMRREQESQRETTRAEQQAVVAAVAEGLEWLSSGDLTYRIRAPFAAEYEKLRDDFNAAMEQLQQTVRVIADNTQGIHAGAGEISQAADDLSRRTEQQAASLEETAAALDQITATVRKTSDGANHARQVVSSAKGDAEKGGQVVRDAVVAMTAIEQSARQINQIISVIDEIAFQTNLLALNAGVEAARAGDAGRGFAVVASEVRALAQRSADAAKEIKALISSSTYQVDSGVKLVGQTGEALERIVAQVAEINGVVAEIAASAQEQATGLHEVNSAVNQMDQVTQQNAAMVEQSTAASHALAQEANELARLIGRFKVGAETDVALNQPVVVEPAPRPSTRTPTLGGSGFGRAATALKLEQVAEDDGWEEF